MVGKMEPENIQQLIESEFPNSSVIVTGDGYHFEARVISPAFEGLSLLQRQRLVYKCVEEYLRDGTLHALSIKASTPSENQSEK